MKKFLQNLFGSENDIDPSDAFVKIMQLMGDDPATQKLVDQLLILPTQERAALISGLPEKGMPRSQFAIIRHLCDEAFCARIRAVEIDRT